MGGFLPTSLYGLYRGVPWDASHWKPHDNVDGWLCAHAFSMWIWVAAAVVQFWSGGRPSARTRQIHRWFGYLGFGALSCGMLCGGLVWSLKHDFGSSNLSDLAAGYYTVTISVLAWVNMVVGVDCARRGQFADHKDFVLMAFMWTMDPACQRAGIHLLRFLYSRPDPGTLLVLGKVCGNTFNVLVFGCAAIFGQRENSTLVMNITAEYTFAVWLTFVIFAKLPSSSQNWVRWDTSLTYLVTSVCGAVLAVVGLVYLRSRARLLRHWRPAAKERVVFAAWLVAVGGFPLLGLLGSM